MMAVTKNYNGGTRQDRTAVNGFADRPLTTRTWYLIAYLLYMARVPGLEPGPTVLETAMIPFHHTHVKQKTRSVACRVK